MKFKKFTIFVIFAFFSVGCFALQPNYGQTIDKFLRDFNGTLIWGMTAAGVPYPALIDTDGKFNLIVSPSAGSVWDVSGSTVEAHLFVGSSAVSALNPVFITNSSDKDFTAEVDVTDRIDRLLGKITNYDVLENGTLTATDEVVAMSTEGLATSGLSVSGTWVGTIVCEVNMGNGNWGTIPIIDNTLGTGTLSISANGVYLIGVSGAKEARVRMSAYTSGTAEIYLEGTSASAGFLTRSLPTGINSIGKLGTNSGVDIGDVTINNASGGSAVNIQDGGNSITVDGTFWQDTQPVTSKSADAFTVEVESEPDVATAVPTLYHVVCTNVDTEYSQAVSSVNSIVFHNQGNNDLRYAFVTGKVAGPVAPYMTLKAGYVFSKDSLNISSATLYFASSTAGQTVEIEAW